MASISRCIVLAASVLAIAAAAWPAHAQAPKPLQVQETNVDGVNAELVEAVRKEGVLTIKVRFRNGGGQPARLGLIGTSSDVDKYYVVAGSTKFLPLKDSQRVPLMNAVDNHGFLNPEVKPAGSYLFWAKYPAPPAEAKKVNFYTPRTPPFEDIPITEAK
jgi:hypothetical protein